MSVTAFRMKNFMGFEDSGWIELRPITLLFGRNSTGKSAIMRALLLLRQSLRSRAEYGPLLFVDENGYDLGSYADLVRDHDLNYKMSFAFRQVFRRPLMDQVSKLQHDTDAENIEAIFKEMRVIDSEDSRESVIVETELVYKFDKQQQRTQLCQFSLVDGTSGKLILSATRPNTKSPSTIGWRLKSSFFSDELKHRHDRPSVWPQISLSPTIGFLPNLVTLGGHTDFFADSEFDPDRSISDNNYESFKHYLAISFRHIRTFFTLFHLGPMRPEPKRFYYAAGRSLSTNAGEGLSFVRRYLDATADDVQLERLDTLQEWLESTFGIRYSVKALDRKESLFELSIQEIGSDFSSNIREVGFGVSQVLPILIQTVVSGQETRLLVEQPELHLHPGAQAQLGDFFIQAAKRGVHFLIETHSEHLLLRLRRRAAETQGDSVPDGLEIAAHDIGIYFVDKLVGVSIIQEVRLNKWGNYKYMPVGFHGFFADDMEELVALGKAMHENNGKEEQDESN